MLRESQMPPSNESELEKLLVWLVGIPCCAHDVHNGLAWAVEPAVTEPRELSKNLWVCIESLRNGLDCIDASIPSIIESATLSEDVRDEVMLFCYWGLLGSTPT